MFDILLNFVNILTSIAYKKKCVPMYFWFLWTHIYETYKESCIQFSRFFTEKVFIENSLKKISQGYN